jgi:hypothetical protein
MRRRSRATSPQCGVLPVHVTSHSSRWHWRMVRFGVCASLKACSWLKCAGKHHAGTWWLGELPPIEKANIEDWLHSQGHAWRVCRATRPLQRRDTVPKATRAGDRAPASDACLTAKIPHPTSWCYHPTSREMSQKYSPARRQCSQTSDWR